MPFKNDKQKRAFFAKKGQTSSTGVSGKSNLQQHTADNLPELASENWDLMFKAATYNDEKRKGKVIDEDAKSAPLRKQGQKSLNNFVIK
jgi:hypothetical protein